jgi:hypothetical protein
VLKVISPIIAGVPQHCPLRVQAVSISRSLQTFENDELQPVISVPGGEKIGVVNMESRDCSEINFGRDRCPAAQAQSAPKPPALNLPKDAHDGDCYIRWSRPAQTSHRNEKLWRKSGCNLRNRTPAPTAIKATRNAAPTASVGPSPICSAVIPMPVSVTASVIQSRPFSCRW